MRPIYFYSLWAINGPLDQQRLFNQLQEFKRLGLDGVVFHPRFYPGKPPYLSEGYLKILNETILRAKKLGMRFWIYDENGWPSGTADGQLYTKYPADMCQRLDMVTVPAGQVLDSFKANGQTWFLVVQEVRGIDCYNPEATSHFLESIHEKYRMGLTPEAFDYVEAFFTDEPESGLSWEPMPQVAGVPWSRKMPEYLRNHFGADVTLELRLLFVDAPEAAQFRREYWELVTDLFCQGFLDPYRDWCERHGKLLVGHVKGEEHPLFQLPMVGSCQRVYRHFSIPGIDALERYPSNHFFPRQASSVARQFGNGRCMVEAGGGAGWGSSPEDLQRYLLWLGKQGMTDFVLHLSQYQLDSAALYDWPPSQPLHLSWKEAYPEVLRHVRQELTNASSPRSSLVIAPYRRIMEAYEPWELLQINIHNGSHYLPTPTGEINSRFMKLIESLHSHSVEFDITDERSFEESATVVNGGIQLGNGHYTSLVIPEDVVLNKEANLLTDQVMRFSVSSGEHQISTQVAPEPPVTRLDLPWHSLITPENAYLLDIEALDPGLFKIRLPIICEPAADLVLSLVFPEEVREVSINGSPKTITGEGRVGIQVLNLSQESNITFKSDTHSIKSFVWLTGHFAVKSQTPYIPGPNGSLRTDGPLEIAPLEDLSPNDEFVEAGLPFAFKPVEAAVSISLPVSSRKIRFKFASASPDAMCVFSNGKILGWVWGPDWTLQLDHNLPKGKHVFQVWSIPNSYNYYGPHHYYLGDGPVISPDQVRGVRNFADPIDAPFNTHVDAFHFKPWALPRYIEIF